MTSKEKCYKLYSDFDETEDRGYNVYDYFKEIIKDLELLEQLKEILSMDYLVRVYGYDMAKRLQTYLKSNDAIKRWLDNGKDNK